MNKKSFLSLLFIFISFAAIVCANQEYKLPLMEKLYSNNDQSILGHEDGRFYLNPQRLSLSLEGIFLRTDAWDFHPISALFFDKEKCAYYQTDHWICSGGHRVPISFTMCPVCKAKK